MGAAKTNAIRALERAGIPYKAHTYEPGDKIDGVSAAQKLGKPVEQVFKTLVTAGKSGGHYVFVIPVAKELDLKKAAQAAGEKSVEMIHVKEIHPLTGYIRGGCSPVGMKKQFPTVLDLTAREQESIVVSAGKIGFQMELSPKALAELLAAKFADVTG